MRSVMRTAGVRDHLAESELLEPGIALRRIIVRCKPRTDPARYLVGAPQTLVAVEALCSGFGPASRER
jgi:hypothetical protein